MIPVSLIRWQLTGKNPRSGNEETPGGDWPSPSPSRPLRSADTTLDYDVLHFGKKSGAQTVVLRDGGRMHVTYSYRDNGRGPDIEEDIALLPDGTFGRYRQTGNDDLWRGPRREVLDLREARELAVARGARTAGDRRARALPADLRQPGDRAPSSCARRRRPAARLAALPGGELRSERLASTRVGAAGGEREVALYAIFGAGLQPEYVWLETAGDMPLFASISIGGGHVVRAGFADCRRRARAPAAGGRGRLAIQAGEAAHAGPAPANPDQERPGVRRQDEEPRRARRRLRQRGADRGSLPGRLSGQGPGDGDRRRRTRAAAGPVRHALARGRLERRPADRGRRHDLARHGQLQRRPRAPARRHRGGPRRRAAHRAGGLHRGREPLRGARRLRRRERRRGGERRRLVRRARFPADQALQLDQAGMGAADRGLRPLARPARERPRARILALRARRARGLRRAAAHQPDGAQFRLRPGHGLAHDPALQPGRRAGEGPRPRLAEGEGFHPAAGRPPDRGRRDPGDVRGLLHPEARRHRPVAGGQSPTTCRSRPSAACATTRPT